MKRNLMIFNKKYLVWGLLFMAAACGNTKTEESIEEQINQYRKEVSDINMKIAELERELQEMDPSLAHSSALAVATEQVDFTPFEHLIQVSGTAEAVNEAFISSEMSGQVTDIYVKEGDFVRKGQLLAKLNTEVIETNIAEVKSQLELATVVFEKQERLWEQGIGSEMQFLNAKTNKETLDNRLETMKAQLRMSMIESPVDGYVDEIYRKKGEMAMPGAQIMQVVNLEKIYINVSVAESYLSFISEGDIVEVGFPVYPDISLNVPVYRKGNIINPNNRTFTVQLKLDNPDNRIKPNMLSVVRIKDFSTDSALVVPSIIIKQDITGTYLYVIDNKDNKITAKKVYVKAGKSFGDRSMILEGLEPGAQVIVEGYNQVSDGSAVRIENTNEPS